MDGRLLLLSLHAFSLLPSPDPLPFKDEIKINKNGVLDVSHLKLSLPH